MNKKDNTWLIIIAIIFIAMLLGYMDREEDTIVDTKINNSDNMIINSSQMRFDAEVEKAGGWKNYQQMQKLQDCWDACDGYDDPDCVICVEMD